MKVKQNKVVQILAVMVLDAWAIMLSGGFALMVRFEFSLDAIPKQYLEAWFRFLPLQICVMLAIFFLTKMYHYMWRSVGVHEVLNMLLSVMAAYVVAFVVCRLLGNHQPRSVVCISLMCQMFLLVGIRCSYRFLQAMEYSWHHRSASHTGEERILLIGAGEAGQLLAKEIMGSARVSGDIICVIDDDSSKWGRYLGGAPIVGGRDAIHAVVRREKITQIILAMPSAPAAERREILDRCKDTGCRIRVLPGIYQLINGEVSLSQVKDVQIEDLLGRDPVRLDTEALEDFLQDKTVMVTGGGGSIGSELCRQIAPYHPRRLIILDIYENNAYDIQQELRRTYPKLDLRVEIASIRDKEKIYDLFDALRPDIVFHAAAHKHVPLMENCPSEAIKNNVFGTYHVVRAAEKFGVKKFVMISTDKAVNPTNIMGATKRFCEMVLQSRVDSPTEFCAVRFGNVLGSNGSVVPLFKRQIEAGGPVTITDKRIIRYFMTIPEAAQLVLEAGAMAKRSQIFVLDMGEPVKILTLAENLIRLSGLEPYEDIAIEEIGLRPGEKLYEELLMSSQTLVETANEKIFVEQQEEIDPAAIMAHLQELDRAVTDKLPDEELIDLMRKIVPTYYAPEEINARAQKKDGVLA